MLTEDQVANMPKMVGRVRCGGTFHELCMHDPCNPINRHGPSD